MGKRRNWRLKGLIILLLLIVSAIYVPKAMLRYSGYCFEQKRYLSTQEKFDIVITHIINRKKGPGGARDYEHPAEGWRRAYTVTETGGKVFLKQAVEVSLNYASLTEFYALNPNACELVEIFWSADRRYHVPFWPRLRGDFNIMVRVFYIYDFDVENDNQPIYREEYFGLSNCGVLWTAKDIMKLQDSKW